MSELKIMNTETLTASKIITNSLIPNQIQAFSSYPTGTSTTIGPGSNGQALKSTGSAVYWDSINTEYGGKNLLRNGNLDEGLVDVLRYMDTDSPYYTLAMIPAVQHYTDGYWLQVETNSAGTQEYCLKIPLASLWSNETLAIKATIKSNSDNLSYTVKFKIPDVDYVSSKDFSAMTSTSLINFSVKVPDISAVDTSNDDKYAYLHFKINSTDTSNKLYATNIEVTRGAPSQNYTTSIIRPNSHFTYDNTAYVGKDLSKYFSSLYGLHIGLRKGDFSLINIGDYYPLTLSGTFKDYGSSTTKTIDITLNMLVANIYSTYSTSPQITFISDILLPFTFKYYSSYSSGNGTNNWLNSSLYQTLNNTTDGLIKLIPSNGIQNFNTQLFVQGTSTLTSKSRGKLFLPSPEEVFEGLSYNSNHATCPATVWPIFLNSTRHIIKKQPNSTLGSRWWLLDKRANTSTNFPAVTEHGSHTKISPTTELSIPLCFIA